MPPERKTTLWRVIGSEELKDILKLKRLKLLKGGMEIKSFTTTYDFACDFSNKLSVSKIDCGKKHIIMVSINTRHIEKELAELIFVDRGIQDICLNARQLTLLKSIYLIRDKGLVNIIG